MAGGGDYFLGWIRRILLALTVLAVTCYSLEIPEEARKKKGTALLASSKEANVGTFVRLVAMRLVFALAYQVGLGEWASGLFNGALAPPGSDYDYGDYGGDDDDGDYDY